MILLSLFKKYWPAVLLAIILSGIVYTVMGLKADLSSTTTSLVATQKELVTTKEQLSGLAQKYDELVDQVALRETRLNLYYSSLQNLEQMYANTSEVIKTLQQQESLAAKNPAEYTAKLQKLYNDSEREFSCITGNLQFCSSP